MSLLSPVIFVFTVNQCWPLFTSNPVMIAHVCVLIAHTMLLSVRERVTGYSGVCRSPIVGDSQSGQTLTWMRFDTVEILCLLYGFIRNN